MTLLLAPLLPGSAVGLLTAEPRVDEARVAGVPARDVRPGRGRGPWPAMLMAGNTPGDPLGVRLVGPLGAVLVLLAWLSFRGYERAWRPV